MKENKLYKYIGKRVELTDIINETRVGMFYKVSDRWWTRNDGSQYMAVTGGYSGYVLDFGDGYQFFIPSFIKKIKIIRGK